MGGIESTATISGRSATLVEDGASIAGNIVSVQALSDDRPIADVEAAAGGILTKGQNIATARVLRPQTIVDRVATFVPNAGVTINAANLVADTDLTIAATQLAEADAFAKGLAVGALAAGKSEAVVIVTPEVATAINADATLTAGDQLLISAEFGEHRTGTVVARNVTESGALAKDALSSAYAKGSGGKQNDVLVGGDGDDVLDGGKGINVLIGGRGADDLAAKKGEALLIAGYTAFDQNEAALDAILAEWSSGKSRSKRIEHLTGDKSGGKNAAYFLIGAGSSRTVFDDAALDRVSANKAKDWIFANLDAGVQDIVPKGSEVEEIDL
jgi:Ca2+-binding RTX toxin-like protein